MVPTVLFNVHINKWYLPIGWKENHVYDKTGGGYLLPAYEEYRKVIFSHVRHSVHREGSPEVSWDTAPWDRALARTLWGRPTALCLTHHGIRYQPQGSKKDQAMKGLVRKERSRMYRTPFTRCILKWGIGCRWFALWLHWRYQNYFLQFTMGQYWRDVIYNFGTTGPTSEKFLYYICLTYLKITFTKEKYEIN